MKPKPRPLSWLATEYRLRPTPGVWAVVQRIHGDRKRYRITQRWLAQVYWPSDAPVPYLAQYHPRLRAAIQWAETLIRRIRKAR